MLHDTLVAVLAFVFAVILKFETLDLSPLALNTVYPMMTVVVLSQIIFFKINGLYKGMWRFSSTVDLFNIIKAVTYGTALPLIILFLWNRLESFPRSIIVIDYAFLIIGLGGGRFVYRLWNDSFFKRKVYGKENLIVIGAGSAGNQIVKEIKSNPHFDLNIVGFLDDDPSKKIKSIQGIPVLGATSDLARYVRNFDVKKVFIAIPSAKGIEVKRIIDNCQDANVEFRILPKINDLLNGKIELSLLRKIKLEDLLGRDPVILDKHKLGKFINNRIIMVTGAGGSIGSELCHQIARFNPKCIILFEVCELFLFDLENKLNRLFPEINFIPVIGDIRNKDRVEKIISIYRPEVVIHAAAYKHVPMMEKNPSEAIKTNVFGTKIVAEAAIRFNVDQFVMVSTDKAVNPTNIMGATKRIAEMICQFNNQQRKTKFTTVRFGNVLGSKGSVIPFFKEQIENGGPITITHKEITRYFMSIPEACQLILQSATMSDGGEIFVLDMGSPVKIVDLARNLIKLSGLEPEIDIEFDYIGLRPGEKLYEELFSEKEQLVKTGHEKVRKAFPVKIESDFTNKIELLSKTINDLDKKTMTLRVREIILSYFPSEVEEGIYH